MKRGKTKFTIRPVYIGFFITLFVAAIVMNLVYMVYYSYRGRKLDESEHARTLNQTVYYTNRYMKEVEDGANMLSISSAVQKLMTHRIQKNYMDYLKGTELLTEYAMTIPGIYRIDFYVQSNSTLLTSYEGVYYDLPEEDAKEYQKYMESNENWFWDIHYAGNEPELVKKTRNEEYISFIKPVYSKYTGKKGGILCISIPVSQLEDIFPMNNTSIEGIQIFNESDAILEDKEPVSGVKQISQTSEYTGMYFTYYYLPQIRMSTGMPMLFTIFVITIFFAVIFLCIVEISEKKMFYPVTVLLHGFENVEQGNFDIHLDENRKDLFREIFIRFNHMAETLKHMIEELSDERTKRNEFKFRLLQMQIKPHFLYNLFNNMVWMVEQKDYEPLERLIESTAGYYKTALNYGNQDIMLVENQKQLEYYVEIQKIRFGDIFTFDMLLPEELQFLAIPNLLLQPLVENAIVHGLKTEENAITHIEVEAQTRGEQMVLIVRDDGRGIAPEVLTDIKKEMENYEGDGSRYFALVNVTARIHNRYKCKAHVTIESRVNQGTVITVTIPLSEVK